MFRRRASDKPTNALPLIVVGKDCTWGIAPFTPYLLTLLFPETPVAEGNIDDEERRKTGICATPRSLTADREIMTEE